ncbi:MAG: PDZ domain-containing protein, partial [Bacteroidota bacterium]|nr:PDZ domain-containing protein [Bacteroidota bacterium]
GIFGWCFDSSYSAMVRQLHVGDMIMDSIVISSEKNARAHVILGTNVLRHHNFVIDWQSKQIIFRSTEADTSDKRSFGFGSGLQDDKLLVMFVYDDSPAGKAGIRAGSQILQINGKNVEQLSLDDYCSLTSKKLEGDTLYLTVKEEDSVRRVVLFKDMLFRN